MRFLIKVSLKKSNALLPYDHQYYLAAYVYRTIERTNPEYSLELHRPRKYKHFTFSYLMAKQRRNTGRGILIEDDEIYFFISSPDAEFLKALVEGMLENPEIKIKNIDGVISEIKVLKQHEFKKRTKMRTISPIVVKKAIDARISNRGKKIRWINLYPTDEEFCERLVSNLKKRFTDYYGKNASDKDLKIEILNFKPKRHKIVNTYHRCVLCDMVVEGDKELIKYGYEAGFGEKNAMGFGMVKVISKSFP